jgi:hypothetical protein
MAVVQAFAGIFTPRVIAQTKPASSRATATSIALRVA